jgi:transposase InsO family protein
MHEALILIARAIALAHDRWRARVGTRRPLSGKIAVLEERVQRLEAENALLRARFLRLPARRRPHYRPHERLEILWHAARHRLSVTATAHAFGLSRQTVINWRRVAMRKNPPLLSPMKGLSDVIHELIHRLKREWPRWGTRRIAGQLARLGVKASRTSVQRTLRHPRRPRPNDRLLPVSSGALVAKRPNHIWMIDFTRLKGMVRPVYVGAGIDAFSRKVLAVGVIRGAPNAQFGARLLRRATRRYGAPIWLVSDKDPALRSRLLNAVLRRHGIRRRYGAVGRKGSIAIIERMWRSMKQEYVRHLLLYRSTGAIETRVRRWARWFNAERPHQGLGQQTPDEVYRGRPPRVARDLTDGMLHVRFLDGDKRLPILRLRRAA